jgi:hypothetical protein
MNMEDQKKQEEQFPIDLKEEVAQGTYANLVIIGHSPSEFVLDFARVLPGLPKASVQSRIILAPEHAKRLLFALQDNIMKYEHILGPIQMPEDKIKGKSGPEGTNFMPPIGGIKGDA